MSKKIFSMFLMLILTATSVAGVNINENKKNANTDGYELAVMRVMPPESERVFEKMDPDPEPTMSYSELPSQFSWTNYNGNWLTPVKDQAYPVYCGSCYIFGTWGAFEAAINIAAGYPDLDIDLSEQYGLSCINSGCYGCNGGWGTIMVNNIVSTGPEGNGINGVPIESCMPYQAVDWIPCEDKCEDWDYHTDPPQADNKLWQIKDWGWFTTSEKNPDDWELIKTYLYTKGPLAVTIAWDSGLQNFVETHHDPDDVYQQDSSDHTNHILVLCGWVDDENIYNGGYWILKNSHGTEQGYGGYCNIAYGCNQVACSECIWIVAEDWPEEQRGPGPGKREMHVFSDFSWEPKYPHLGEPITFIDQSMGKVVLWEWDFDGDGVVDVSGPQASRPKWTYYEEGEYEVTLTVWSSYGLNSTRVYNVGVHNVWPPKAVVQPEEYAGRELEIYFEGRYSYDVDDGNIVSYHWDFDDGGTSDESYVTHRFPEGDRIYNVTLTVTDNDGASSSVVCPVKIDITVPPVTEAVFGLGCDCDCMDSSEWWFKDQVLVQLVANDWTGLSKLCYKVDDGEYEEVSIYNEKTYTHRFRIREPGIHQLKFYSVDVFGNKEHEHVEEVKIDVTPPTLDVTISGEQSGERYVPPVEVIISGSDDLSGIESYKYRLDGSLYDEWNEYTGPFTINEGGPHILECLAIDKAGNTAKETLSFIVDYAPSAPKISGPHKVKPEVESKFTFTSFDLDAGDEIYFYIDWGDGNVEEWIGPYYSNEKVDRTHTYSGEGTYKLKAKAKDQLGAESDWTTMKISAPRTGLFQMLLLSFLEEHPRLFPILRILLQNWG